ncbi:DUF2946 domain-containing protein [Yersinia sp. 2540 StPb PI]|uniref:DUF2946 domain-containing protein n=1 Tax=Yersinia sp. 2540 StPb PI TaxID=3117406 RepID=UPI003FA49E2B
MSQILYQRRRFSAWLGIAAILMLFIAPVVSVSLALSYEQKTISTMSVSAAKANCAMDMAHHADPQQSQTTAQHSNTAQAGGGHDGMMMDHAACGYCVLLTHLPLLNTAFKADIRSALLLAEIPAPSFIYWLIIQDTYSESQPRAPPAFYS